MRTPNPLPAWRDDGAVEQVRVVHREAVQQLGKLLGCVSDPAIASRCAREIRELARELDVIAEKFRNSGTGTDEADVMG